MPDLLTTPPAGGPGTDAQPGSPQVAISPTGPAGFIPLKPKNPDSDAQRKVIETYNSFRQNGGQDSALNYQATLDVLSAAEGGNPKLSADVALSDPETYYQQVYKHGKTPQLLSQQVQTGAWWVNLVPDFVTGTIGLAKDLAVGGAQRFVHELQAVNPFATNEERLQAGAKVISPLGGAVENAWVMPQRLINGASDMIAQSDLHAQLADPNLTPEQRTILEKRESEIYRNRQLREEAYNNQISGAKKDVAGIYRAFGFVDMAKAIMSDKGQPTPEETTLVQTVMDPTNLLTEGVGAIAGGVVKAGVRTMAFEDSVRALNAAETRVATLAAKRTALETRIAAAGSDAVLKNDLESQLARQAPLERSAADVQVHALGSATELGRTVKDQMDGMVPGGIVRKIVGNTIGGLGDTVERLAGTVEKLQGVSDSAAARIAGANADAATTQAIGKQINNWATRAIKGTADRVVGGVGGAFGAAVGGPVGMALGYGVGEAVNAGVKILMSAPNLAAVARDFKTVGAQLSLGRQTLPFWRAVSEKTTGLTSAIASKLDNQLVYAIPGAAKGYVGGALTGAALSTVASGGEAQGTVQGAIGGGLFGLAGGGLGQIGRFNAPATLHIARIGDRSRFIASMLPRDRAMFNRLRPDEQLAVSVYALAHPDLHVQFYDDPKGSNGSHYVDDRGGVVTLNVAGDNPIKSILEHELAHHIAAHDLSHVVTDYMVGNVLKGEPGIFTKYGEDGKPVLDTDPATGKVSYMVNEAFTRYQGEYNARKLRDVPGAKPEDVHGISQEMFAELHAAAFKDPLVTQKMVRGFVRSDLVSSNVLANWFGKMGMGYDGVTGTPLTSTSMAQVRGLTDLVTRYHKDRAWKNHPMEHEAGLTRIGPETWRADPETIYRNLDGAGVLSRDPKTGNIYKDASGLPIIKSSAGADADLAKMTKSVVDFLQANPRIQGQAGDNVMKLVTDRDGRQFYRGQVTPQELLNHLAGENAHNPYQIQNWQKLDAVMGRNDGSMVLINYNTPQKGGKYASLAMKERAVVPIWSEVSPNTKQVSIKAYDPEQMGANVSKMLKRPVGKELWDGKITAALDDVNTYLGNLVAGRPGEAEIGLRKKGVLNELFGFPAQANPGIADLAKRPTNQSVLKSFRLDRINRVRETAGVTRPFHEQTYEQVTGYAQPRTEPIVALPRKQAVVREEPFSNLPDHALPRLSDVAQTKHLPKGAHFLDPKGVRRKVPHG